MHAVAPMNKLIYLISVDVSFILTSSYLLLNSQCSFFYYYYFIGLLEIFMHFLWVSWEVQFSVLVKLHTCVNVT